MKIVKQTGKHNQFNIENMTMGRILQIILALEYCRDKGLLNTAGNQLCKALNNQEHKLKF